MECVLIHLSLLSSALSVCRNSWTELTQFAVPHLMRNTFSGSLLEEVYKYKANCIYYRPILFSCQISTRMMNYISISHGNLDDLIGRCTDREPSTPCCGRGRCNAFCCNCAGGCWDESHRQHGTHVLDGIKESAKNTLTLGTSAVGR